MGGGRDKRKKAKEKLHGPVIGKGADKTERKTKQKEEKREKRAERKLAGDEDDIDAMLAKFAIEQKGQTGVVVDSDCPPPGPRVNASFTPYITPKGNDIFLFGGEHTDLKSDKVYVNADLYRWSCDKAKWSKITAPGGPQPRSAHQAVVYKNQLIIFGGEFTSPNQERFLHYKDLWRLDLTTWEWDCLPLKGGPSARSGHRMALYKHKALLFGGFYDTGKEVKYFNDLWELDLGEMCWRSVGRPGAACPSPRSGCGLLVAGDTLWVFGGYSKARDEEDKELEHGKAMDDIWACNLTTYTWEVVKKAGMAPGPRASFSMALCKGRAFLFGGVSDNEARGGEDLSSDFHNDLYTFSLDKRRWFAAEVRPPPTKKGEKGLNDDLQPGTSAGGTTDGASTSGTAAGSTSTTSGTAKKDGAAPISKELQDLISGGHDKSSAIYKAAVKIQARFRGYVVQKAYKVYRLGGVISEILYSPAVYGLDMSVLNAPKPKARICTMVAVVGQHMWLQGGIVEVGEKEITLDDMWRLDLVKLDGWQLVKENSVGEEIFRAAAKAAEGASSSDDDSEWESD